MTSGEEKAKRWRITIRRLLGHTTAIAVALGLICLPVYPWFSHYDIAGDLRSLGLFSFGGCIAGFCCYVWRGTALAYAIGFIVGGVATYVLILAYLQLTHGFSPR